MAEAASILRRKTVPGGGSGGDGSGRATPEKAMKLAFGRAGRGLARLGLQMTGFSMERAGVAALAGAAGEGALVLLLRRGGAAGGAVVIEPGMIAALVEAETMGRLARSAAEPRAPTRIDALIVSGFLTAALEGFDEAAGDLSLAPQLTGWRPGEMVAQPRSLPLMLEDQPMRAVRIGFDFGEGARSGGLILAVPMAGPRPRGSAAESLGEALREAVLGARADVRAVLARLPLPLDSVSRWEPGALVPLPRELLARVRIEDIDGETVARGRLGQVAGSRAVRIVEQEAGG